MRIISFATQESEWRKPRLGIILSRGDHDTGYRLDCEKLFDLADRPTSPLAWFDLDREWFQIARATAESIVREDKALADAKE
jgi:hypothetical protein